MYLIGAKLDFHGFMGPEGQEKHLFKQDDTSCYNFQAIFCKGRLQKEKKKVKRGFLA